MSLSLSRRIKPLFIYGPKGIKKFIKSVIKTMNFELTYPIKIIEIKKEITLEYLHYKITIFQLDHRISTLGFCYLEHPSSKFDVEKLRH